MKRVLLLIALSLGFLSFGQQGRLKEANALYSKMAYYYAAEAYEDVLERAKDSSMVAVRLADCYDKIENNEKAVIWYNYLSNNAQLNQKQMIRLAVVRRQVGDYTGSLGMLSQYETKYGGNDVTKKMILEHDALDDLQTDKGTFTITTQDVVNSDASDMGASYYKDNELFVSSAKKSRFVTDDTYTRQANKFYNIYTSTYDEAGNLSKTKRLKNTKFHDGPIIYDKENDLVYFTRNNFTNHKKKTDVNKVMRLKIYQGRIVKKKITEEKELAFNSDEFSSGHPSLSKDGRTMFFASDRPGGFGGSDIYKVTINADGTTGDPINMGASVNTSLNEFFPNLHSESNKLFFASEGHIGLGGLDNFVGQLNKEQNQVLGLINLGAPVNSRFDDFGVILNSESTKGYFVSNRDTGRGDDDIYGFTLNKPLPSPLILEGLVTDAKTNQILPFTKVNLIDDNNKVVATTDSDELGKYNFGLDPSILMDYKLKAVRDSFADGEQQFSTKNLPANTQLVNRDLALVRKGVTRNGDNLALHFVIKDKESAQPINGAQLRLFDNVAQKELVNVTTDANGDFYLPLNEKKVYDELSFNIISEKEGYETKRVFYKSVYETSGLIELEDFMEIGDAPIAGPVDFGIKPIYFNLDKSNIRTDAKIELDKIVAIMNDYPEMVIELGSHTDCRQTNAYNDRLSARRAQESAAYIKARITNPSRISGKGYGETQLATFCPCEPTNESTCSEDQHQLNRRTEFKIINVGSIKKGVDPNKTYALNNIIDAPRETTYIQNVTTSEAIVQEEMLAERKVSQSNLYKVSKDETLHIIFLKTGVSVQELKRLNNLSSSRIYVNQVLKLS